MEQPHMRLFYCRRPTAYARLENVALCKFGTRVVAARKAGEVSSPITVPSERTLDYAFTERFGLSPAQTAKRSTLSELFQEV